jgi:hypothetical protein
MKNVLPEWWECRYNRASKVRCQVVMPIRRREQSRVVWGWMCCRHVTRPWNYAPNTQVSDGPACVGADLWKLHFSPVVCATAGGVGRAYNTMLCNKPLSQASCLSLLRIDLSLSKMQHNAWETTRKAIWSRIWPPDDLLQSTSPNFSSQGLDSYTVGSTINISWYIIGEDLMNCGDPGKRTRFNDKILRSEEVAGDGGVTLFGQSI